MVLVSVIIASHNEGSNLRKTVDSILENTDFSNYEIIVVDDSSDDGSIDFLLDNYYKKVLFSRTNYMCPNKSRNRGASIASGGVLIFLDAHIFPITRNWMSDIFDFIKKNPKSICGPCITAYGNNDSKGYGFTFIGPKLEFSWLDKKHDYPYEVPAVGAACLAIGRDSFNYIGGFSKEFISWGYDDAEICIRAWLMGLSVFVLPQIDVYHVFRNKFHHAIDNNDVNYNLLVTSLLHFNDIRISKISSALEKESDVKSLFLKASKNGILKNRSDYSKKNVFNDDWFFEKFDIKI